MPWHNIHIVRGTKRDGSITVRSEAEIVTLLRDDPNTDWAQVDIKALRDHLVDMDNVTTRASIERTVDGIGVTFIVTGDDVVAASSRRMVLTHSPILQRTIRLDRNRG